MIVNNNFQNPKKERCFMPEFKTVRKTAAPGFITESHLRRLIKTGQCPGYYAGSRFMVNVTALTAMLDGEGRKAAIQQ